MAFSDRNNEKDEFWNLEKLVPKKKASLSHFATAPVTREYSPSADIPEPPQVQTRTEQERKLSFDGMRGVCEMEDITYYPENTLLKSVTIKKYKENYDFYDSFRKAAILYYDCPGEKCEFAQFFSYMPQYSQLTKTQKEYYFYWRSEMRRGNFIKTDYSYLYLYVYEIINLPDVILPKEGIELLCTIWKQYRKALPRIDMYFSVWVRDYCLVHKLPCPMDKISDFIFDVIRISDFKEYYFTDIEGMTRDGIWTMLAYLSDYDWRRGFYSVLGADAKTEEQERKQEIYKTLLERSMRAILPTVWAACLAKKNEGELTKIKCNAFPNTLCTHSVKCKLEISYYPLAEAQDLRAGVTAALRYAENRIRALFGVKSRLSVKVIPDVYKTLIDSYFDTLVMKAATREKVRNLPEYEKMYDAPEDKLSFSGADEIERLSWDTTKRLCDTTEDTEEILEQISENETKITESTEAKTEAETYGLNKTEVEYISQLLRGEMSLSLDIPEQTVVERINEAFFDGFGDVIIESDGNGFAIIEDYKEEIIQWLEKI